MGVRGNTRQEKKIEGMVAIVEQLHPGLNQLSAKGVFRLAIADTLKEWHLSDWKGLATRPAGVREKFFAAMSGNAAAHLERIGFPAEKKKLLEHRLQEFNTGFLNS